MSWSSNLVNRRTRNFSHHPCIDESLWEVIKGRGKNEEPSQDLIESPRSPYTSSHMAANFVIRIVTVHSDLCYV